MMPENTNKPAVESKFSFRNLDSDTCPARSPDLLEDGRGFTYRSVRICDLERFSIR